MRAEFLGVPIDALTFDETVARAVDAMRSGRMTQHVAINVAKLVKLQHDPELRRDVTESHIVGIDGMGIVWGARALGVNVPERVAGVDLMESAARSLRREGFRPYLFGARQHVLETRCQRGMQRWPRLRFAGYRDGYFERARRSRRRRRDPRKRAPIACSSPCRRRARSGSCTQYRVRLGVPFIMGVGGAHRCARRSRRARAAPMQRSGLEWLYRIYQEPRRMWWRYAEHQRRRSPAMLGKALVGRALRRDASQHRIRTMEGDGR